AGEGERIRFSSAILPPWARRSRRLDALLPVLYLRGISTGDFQGALTALLGTDAPNRSPAVIPRPTAGGRGEDGRWQRCGLATARSAAGRGSTRSFRARGTSAAGCTRP